MNKVNREELVTVNLPDENILSVQLWHLVATPSFLNPGEVKKKELIACHEL